MSLNLMPASANAGARRPKRTLSRRLLSTLLPVAAAGAYGLHHALAGVLHEANTRGADVPGTPRNDSAPAFQQDTAGTGPALQATAKADGVALGLYQPAFPDNLSTIEAYRAHTGQGAAVVHWYALWGGWKRDLVADDLDRVAAAGAVPLITWEPWAGENADPAWTVRRSVLSGRHDAYIESWARGMASHGQPVLLRWAHEMHHHPGYPWAVGINGNTDADYLAAWRYVRRIFAAFDTGQVQWVWSPNTLGDAPSGAHETVYRRLYPGDDEVDWVGLDVFNTGPDLDWGAPYWRSFVEVLAAPYVAITRVSSRPVILPEVGCAEKGGSKAEWTKQALGAALGARFPRVRGLVWFDVAKEQPWQLRSSEEAHHAWLSMLSLQQFAPTLTGGGPASPAVRP